MPSTLLDPLSSIAASSSGLDGSTLEPEAPPTRPTPPATGGTGAGAGGGKDELKGKEGEDKDKDKEKGQSWWEWLTHKADGIEEWVDQFINDHVKGQGKKEGDDTKGESR
jgi:hypothetical protein